ncbi:SDR family oxidoreductase [Streptomyces sp. SID3343]|uniref:SDR family NAD(P)-dependent oxidoreductase n=1 Tax=Streptomyces sp. SID3343 TaxID=2690260 RepID=UPI001371D7F7|nr:SDR family oxidoreductase [Streptomyces sp. SID3343]MYV98671.1 glucose 1-dehydrogenase [Streptomyces sp. SID3343]
MRGLIGKRVLVSGGSSGIGIAAARRFLEEGCRVVVSGLDPAEVDDAVAELRPLGEVTGFAVDVSHEPDATALVEAAVRELGGIDVLANNAGIAWREPFLEITAEHFDRMLAVNLRGMFLVGQAVGRHMAERGGGVIVNMSSTNGIAGEEDYAHYNASKGGVLLLGKTMAVELGRYGIRVNTLCPGYIRTPLNASIAGAMANADFESTYVADRIPLARAGRPEDVAAAYAFLASDDAAFIHGTELVVDGGQLAVM